MVWFRCGPVFKISPCPCSEACRPQDETPWHTETLFHIPWITPHSHSSEIDLYTSQETNKAAQLHACRSEGCYYGQLGSLLFRPQGKKKSRKVTWKIDGAGCLGFIVANDLNLVDRKQIGANISGDRKGEQCNTCVCVYICVYISLCVYICLYGCGKIYICGYLQEESEGWGQDKGRVRHTGSLYYTHTFRQAPSD